MEQFYCWKFFLICLGFQKYLTCFSKRGLWLSFEMMQMFTVLKTQQQIPFPPCTRMGNPVWWKEQIVKHLLQSPAWTSSDSHHYYFICPFISVGLFLIEWAGKPGGGSSKRLFHSQTITTLIPNRNIFCMQLKDWHFILRTTVSLL